MELHLQNKVVIVTGGSEGIGESITRGLAAEGAVPIIATRAVEASEQLVEALKEEGRTAHFFEVELGEASRAEAVAKETMDRFGRIDAIVNNAGRNDGVGLQSGSPEAFRFSLQQNLFHCYDLVHYALPQLIENRGVIVNISSKVALTGQGGTSGYAAAKGGLLALTREWAAELAAYGIRVNAVLPAEVMTPLYRSWLDQTFDDPVAMEQQVRSKIPLEHRMTTTEEIAATVLFLLSSQSSHTTGQFLIVDGGYVHLDRGLT
jgi:L-fucose dehydrogenase